MPQPSSLDTRHTSLMPRIRMPRSVSLIPRLLLALLASIVTLGLFAQEEIPEVARSLMEEAAAARDANRVDEAIAKYSRVLEVAPELASAYVNLGAVLFETGRYDEALKAYKVALAPLEKSFPKTDKPDPLNAQAYANLGGIYLKQGQWQPALDAYTKSQRLDPKNIGTHYNLGFL